MTITHLITKTIYLQFLKIKKLNQKCQQITVYPDQLKVKNQIQQYQLMLIKILAIPIKKIILK